MTTTTDTPDGSKMSCFFRDKLCAGCAAYIPELGRCVIVTRLMDLGISLKSGREFLEASTLMVARLDHTMNKLDPLMDMGIKVFKTELED